MVWGSIISAGAGLAGSLLGSKASRDAADKNADMQEDFAKNGIRWKVEDAKAAGLHPLAAIGAQTHSFAPSYVGDNSVGSAISNAGSDIGRAVDAKLSGRERLENRLLLAQIEGQEIENAAKASKIATLSQPGSPPAFPEQINPSEVTATRRNNMSLEAARPAPATKAFINQDGTVVTWPSDDAKQAVEDSLYEYEHMYRNRIAPWLSKYFNPVYDFVTKPRRYRSRGEDRPRGIMDLY